MMLKIRRSLARFAAFGLLFNTVFTVLAVGGTNVFDLAADFSTNSNPNGAWTYFGVDSAGNFHTLTNSIAGGWDLSINPYTYITVSTNKPGTLACNTWYFGSPIPQSVPIALDERFTLPPGADGTYLVQISAYAINSLVANSVTVSKNGHVILSIPSDISGRTYPTNVILTLAGGDIVDFLQTDQGQPQIQFEAVLSQPAGSPSITTQPLSQAVVLGSAASFSVTATGAPPLSYQWFFGTNIIAGATNSALSFTNVQFAQGGSYSVAVSGPGGIATSSTTLRVLTALPTNGTNVFDLAADFSTNSNPNGPWTYFGGDTNGNFHVLTNSTPGGWGLSTNPFVYIILSTNIPGTLLCHASPFSTGPVTLDERFTLPQGADGTYRMTITAYPVLAEALVDAELSFSINGKVILSPPPDFSQLNYSTNVTLAAGDTLDFFMDWRLDPRMQFEVVLSQSAASPSITKQPLSETVALGSVASFRVTATGAPPLAYQWFFGTNIIVGATNSALSLTNAQYAEAGSYSVAVSGPGGSVTSSNALLIVQTPMPPSISVQPTNQTIVVGARATLSVVATGSPPFSYQWYVGASGDTASPITGATNAVFTTAQLYSSASFWVTVQNGFGTAKSASALVTVVSLTQTAPSITTQPGNQTLTVGATATLSVVVTGSPPVSYQWYVGASGDTSSPVTEATNSVFTTAQLYSSASFWVSIQNAYGVAKSVSALVTVVPENSARLGFGLSAGFPALTIFGNVGTSYRLEYKTNLQATNWSPLLDILMSSSSYSLTDTGLTNSTRFYRLRSSP